MMEIENESLLKSNTQDRLKSKKQVPNQQNNSKNLDTVNDMLEQEPPIKRTREDFDKSKESKQNDVSKTKDFENRNISFEEFQKKFKESQEQFLRSKSNEIFDPRKQSKPQQINKDSKNLSSVYSKLSEFQKNFPSINKTNSLRRTLTRNNSIIQNTQVVVMLDTEENEEKKVSEFDVKEEPFIISFSKKHKKIIEEVLLVIVGSIILFVFAYSLSDKEQKILMSKIFHQILSFSFIYPAFIMLGAFAIYMIYKKFQKDLLFEDYARKDYKDLILLVNEAKDSETNYIGVFQSQFIKERAEKRNMNESEYIENVLPYLNSFIKENDEIAESEAVIDLQTLKIWRLKNSPIVFLQG